MRINILLILFLFLKQAVCSEDSSCSNSSFQTYQKYNFSSLFDGGCYNCHSDCLTCFGPPQNNQNNCQKCIDPTKFLHQDQCVQDCPISYYADQQSQTCKKCDKNFEKCDQKTDKCKNNLCMKCNQNFYLYKTNSTNSSEQYPNETWVCASKCQDDLIFDEKQQQCVRFCPNLTIVDKITKTCNPIAQCSEITNLNQVYHDVYLWGMLYDDVLDQFITYDENGVILIWKENGILLKKLTFHKSRVMGVSIYQKKLLNSPVLTTDDQDKYEQFKKLNKIYQNRFLISFDESYVVVWQLKDFSILNKINIENSFKIRNSVNFILENYLVGLSKQDECQKLNVFNQDKIIKYNMYGFEKIDSPKCFISKGQEFIFSPKKLKFKFDSDSVIYECKKYIQEISEIYYEQAFQIVFIYGIKGLNLVFLDSPTQDCFLDGFNENDIGIKHLTSYNIKKFMITLIDQSSNIIEFITANSASVIFRYQLNYGKDKQILLLKNSTTPGMFQTFWDPKTERIIEFKEDKIKKATTIFIVNNFYIGCEVDLNFEEIGKRFSINPLNLYDITKLKNKIFVYDVDIDMYDSDGQLKFVIKSLIKQSRNKNVVYNYLQIKQDYESYEPIFVGNYAIQIDSEYIQLWEIPQFNLKNQILINKSSVIPYQHLIQAPDSPFHNCLLLSYQSAAYFYKIPSLTSLNSLAINYIYKIQCFGTRLVTVNYYEFFIVDISTVNATIVGYMKTNDSNAPMRSLLINQNLFYQESNNNIRIVDVKLLKFKDLNYTLPTISNSKAYKELLTVFAIDGKLVSLNSYGYINIFNLSSLQFEKSIQQIEQNINYIYGYSPFIIIILKSGEINFYSSTDFTLKNSLNQFLGVSISYNLQQQNFLILKTSNDMLSFYSITQTQLMYSFYENTDLIKHIYYDNKRSLIIINKSQGGIAVLDTLGNVVSAFNNESLFFMQIKILQDQGLIIAIDNTWKVYKYHYQLFEYILIQTKVHDQYISMMELDLEQNLFMSLSLDNQKDKTFIVQEYLRGTIKKSISYEKKYINYFHVFKEDKFIFIITDEKVINFFSYPDFNKQYDFTQIPKISGFVFPYYNNDYKYIVLLTYEQQIVIIKYTKTDTLQFEILYISEFENIMIKELSGMFQKYMIFLDFNNVIYMVNAATLEVEKSVKIKGYVINQSFLVSDQYMMQYTQELHLIFWDISKLTIVAVIRDSSIFHLTSFKIDFKKNILFQVIAPGNIMAIDLYKFKIIKFYQGIQGNIVQIDANEDQQQLFIASTQITILTYEGKKVFTMNHNSEIKQFFIDKGTGTIISYTIQGQLFCWSYITGQLIIKIVYAYDIIILFIFDKENNIIIIGSQSGKIRFIDYEYIIRKYQLNSKSQVLNSIETYLSMYGSHIIYYDNRSNSMLVPIQNNKLGLYIIHSFGYSNNSYTKTLIFSNIDIHKLYFKKDQNIFVSTLEDIDSDVPLQIKDKFIIQIQQNNIEGLLLFTKQERFYYSNDSGDIIEVQIDSTNKSSSQRTLLLAKDLNQQIIKLSHIDLIQEKVMFLIVQTLKQVIIMKIDLIQVNINTNQSNQNKFILHETQNDVQINGFSKEYYQYSNEEDFCKRENKNCFKYFATYDSNKQIRLFSMDQFKQIATINYNQDEIYKIIILENVYMFVFKNYRSMDVYSLQNISQLQNNQLNLVRKLFTPSEQDNKLRLGKNYLIVYNIFQLNIFRMNDLLSYWIFKDEKYQNISNVSIINDQLCVVEDSSHILIINISLKKILKDVNMYSSLKILSLNYFENYDVESKRFMSNQTQPSDSVYDENKAIMLSIIFYNQDSIHRATIHIQGSKINECQKQINLDQQMDNTIVLDNNLSQMYQQNQNFLMKEQTIVLFSSNLLFSKTFLGSQDIITNLILINDNSLNKKTIIRNLQHSDQEDEDNSQKREEEKYRLLQTVNYEEDQSSWPAQNEDYIIDKTTYGKYYVFESKNYLCLYLKSLFIQNYQFIVNKSVYWNINQDSIINEENKTKELKMKTMFINQNFEDNYASMSNLQYFIMSDMLIDGNQQSFTINIMPNMPFFNYNKINKLVLEKLIIQNYQIVQNNNFHYFFIVDEIKINKLIFRNNKIKISPKFNISAIFQFSSCQNVIINNIEIIKNNVELSDDDNSSQNQNDGEDQTSNLQHLPLYLFSFNATQRVEINNIKFQENKGLHLMHIQNILKIDKQLIDLRNVELISNNVSIVNNIFKYTPITIQKAGTKFINFKISNNSFNITCIQFLENQLKFFEVKQNNMMLNCLYPHHMIHVIQSMFFLSNSILNDNQHYLSSINIEQSPFDIQGTQFISNKNHRGSGGALSLFYCIDSAIITKNTDIENTNTSFLNYAANSLYDIKGIQDLNVVMRIKSSTFRNNSALYFGGAIYSNYSDFVIQESNITQNQAAIGGGIRYEQYIPKTILEIHKNKQKTNSRLLQIQDIPITPIQQKQNKIENNKGVFYGQDIASYPIDIRLSYNKTEFLNYQSGNPIQQNLQVSFVDEDGSPLKYNASSFLFKSNNPVSRLTSQLKIEIVGLDNLIKLDGNLIKEFYKYNSTTSSFQFSFTISGRPLYSSEIYVKSMVIPISPILLNSNPTENLQQLRQKKIEKVIQIHFNNCKRGEIPLLKGDFIGCSPCPKGKYSLDEVTDLEYSYSCKKCPLEAIECEQDMIKLKSGYWRENFITDEIMYCENSPQNCVEKYIYDSNNTARIESQCITGHTGPLCESCDYFNKQGYGQYAKTSRYQCGKCLNLTLQIGFFLLKVLVMMGYLGFTLYKLLYQQYQTKLYYYLQRTKIIFLNKSIQRDLSSFYSKVFIDFIQVLSFLNGFKLRNFLMDNISEGFGNPVQSLQYSYNCIHNFTDQTYLLELRLIQCLCMPWVFWISLICISALLKKFLYPTIQLKHHAINLFLLIYFFMFPSTVQTMLSTLSSRKIGNKQYISSDVQFEYMTSEHKRIIFIYIVPCLMLWVFVVPYVIIVKIKKHLKQNNSNIRSRNIYDFLYSEYRENRYYWELVKLIKKGLLIVILNYFESYAIVQGVLMSFIIQIYLILIYNLKPHLNYHLSSLDKENNIIIQICLQLCIFHTKIDYPVLSICSSVLIWTLILTFFVKLSFLFIKNLIFSNAKMLAFYIECVNKWNSKVPDSIKIVHKITDISRVQKNWRKIYKLIYQSIEEKKKGELSTFQVLRMLLYKNFTTNLLPGEEIIIQSQNSKQNQIQLAKTQLPHKKISLIEDGISPKKRSLIKQVTIEDSPKVNSYQEDITSNKDIYDNKIESKVHLVNKSQKIESTFARMSLNQSQQSFIKNFSISRTNSTTVNECSQNGDAAIDHKNQQLQSPPPQKYPSTAQQLLLSTIESPLKVNNTMALKQSIIAQEYKKIELTNSLKASQQHIMEDSGIIHFSMDDSRNLSLAKDRNIQQVISSNNINKKVSLSNKSSLNI